MVRLVDEDMRHDFLPLPFESEMQKATHDIRMSLELFPHNRHAYDVICHLLKRKGKAAVIHPTGTGKSFIAFRLVFDNLQARILWLSPSEYIFRTQVESLRKSLFGVENRRKNLADLEIENQRKSLPDLEKEKERTLRRMAEGLEFMTYSRLMLCADSFSEKKLDYIILDEFHRCGASEWGKGVRKLLLEHPEAKILGLSATNVRYLDGQRDMAEELFAGCVASKMTLGEAVAEKILPAPCYVISMYSYQKELEHIAERVKNGRDSSLRRQNEELLEKLRRSLEQADGLETVFGRHIKNRHGKYIVFCSGKSHMEEMISHVGEWFSLVDRKPHIYRVSFDDSGAGKQFEAFQKDEGSHLKLLFCIDMLNEGVHVEGVDGVILLRPTVSPTLYLQQIGRGLVAGRGREEQPVIFDVVNNFESLSLVDSLQGEFEQALAFLQYTGEEKTECQNTFQVIDELLDCRKLFRTICQNLSSPWDVYYQEAEAFYKKEGHLEVKKRYVTESGLSLGSWILTQRRVRAGTVAGNLSEEQIKRLDAIGMRWKDKRTEKLEKGLAKLEQFVSENGHGDVNLQYVTEDGFPLGKWLCNMRSKYRKGNLEEEAVESLEKAGIVWDVGKYRWEIYYKAAEEYKNSFGDLEIPCSYVTEDGKKLGVWLNNQKSSYRKKYHLVSGTVRETEYTDQCRHSKEIGHGFAEKHRLAEENSFTKEQVQKLEALGIRWEEKSESNFERKYQIAREYYKEHGNLEMPSTFVYKGENLGKWLNELRLARKNTGSQNLTKEKVQKLDQIGMVWEKKDSWEYRCRLAKEYFKKHGNLEISQQYVTEDGIWLGKWLYIQRTHYRKGVLEDWKKEELDKLGMCWESFTESAFEKGCKALAEYFSDNPSKEVIKTIIMPDGYRLGEWVYRQKRKKKAGKLTKEQEERLAVLGVE